MTREVLNEIISGYGMAMREGPDYEDVMKAIDKFVAAKDVEIKGLQESNQRLLDILIQKNIEIDTLKSKKDGKTGSRIPRGLEAGAGEDRMDDQLERNGAICY